MSLPDFVIHAPPQETLQMLVTTLALETPHQFHHHRDRCKPVRTQYPNQPTLIPSQPRSAPRVSYGFLEDNQELVPCPRELIAAVNGHLELTLLKGRQVSTPSRRRILRYINFGIGGSSPILFWDMMNLHLIIFGAWWILNERAFYCFIVFFFFFFFFFFFLLLLLK